jgi:ubiquinone/menaquinone biosynthesis C-methylase UbiE
MDAENLDLEDDSFDVVFGSAILHHLDIARALSEIVRVMRPSGRALFVEPMGHNPAINLYRRLAPEVRTPDEHPLRVGDLRLLSRFFRASDFRFYHLLSLAAVPFRSTRVFESLRSSLDAVDRLLISKLPGVGRYAWFVVLELDGPNREPLGLSGSQR